MNAPAQLAEMTLKTVEFKLDQHWSSSMARMFAHMHPAHASLFEFRVRKGAVVGRLEL